MSGGGIYNRFGVQQNGAHTLSYPTLRASLARITERFKNETSIIIGDLGCSEGLNSLPTMALIVEEIRKNIPQADILNYFNDQPSSDFNTLMQVLVRDDGSPSYADPNDMDKVHPFLLGRSFYDPLFPPSYAHLLVSYITVHWLHSMPDGAPLSGSRIWSTGPDGPDTESLKLWRKQAHNDLVEFISLRSKELCSGGELGVAMVSEGSSAFVKPPPGEDKPVLSASLEQLVEEGLLAEADLEAMAMPYYLRTEAEVRAAADAVQEMETLEIRSFSVDFVEGGVLESQEQLEAVVGMFWAIHEPTLALQLLEGPAGRPPRETGAVLARLKDVFARRYEQSYMGKRVAASYILLWMARK